MLPPEDLTEPKKIICKYQWQNVYADILRDEKRRAVILTEPEYVLGTFRFSKKMRGEGVWRIPNEEISTRGVGEVRTRGGRKMIFCSFFFAIVALYFIIPSIFTNFSQMISQITTILTQNSINISFFETSAQVLASFLAIIFSISLFVIEMSSEKYSPKIKKYYGESLWTKWAFALGLFTILICIICIYNNIQNNSIGAVVLLLLIVNFFFFYVYYNHMKEIIDPYKIADLLRSECINSAIAGKDEIFEDIIASFVDMIIKAINEKDAALSSKYIQTINKINYDISGNSLSVSKKIALREILFNEVARALRYSIDKNDESRIALNWLLFEAIQLEVLR
jgi:hypothetical protein